MTCLSDRRVRFLQANGAEERKIRVPGRQELPGGQEAAEPVPVLPLPEVFNGGHGEGGGANGRVEGSAGPAAHEAAAPAGPGVHAARRPHHRPGQGAHRLNAQA